MLPLSRPATRAATTCALCALCAVLVAHHACGDQAPQSDVDTWALRDLLGLSPSWLRPAPPEARAILQERLSDALLEQSDARPVLRAPDLHASASFDLTVTALDDLRAADDRDPLLVVWLGADAHDVPTARACPLQPDDLDPGPLRADWARAWAIDAAFEATALPSGGTEADALRARLPTLERWLTRCLAVTPDHAAPHKLAARYRITRATSAPFLVAWSPQTQRVAINPLLLALWDTSDARTPSWHLGLRDAHAQRPPNTLRTTTAALDESDVDACFEEVSAYCSVCDTQDKVNANSGNCDDALFNTGEIWENCSALDSGIASGFYRFCLNRITFEVQGSGFNIATCMRELSGDREPTLDVECDVEVATSADELDSRFIGFIETSTSAACLEAFNTCVGEIFNNRNNGGGDSGGDGSEDGNSTSCTDCNGDGEGDLCGGDEGGSGSNDTSTDTSASENTSGNDESCDLEHGCGLDNIVDEDG